MIRASAGLRIATARLCEASAGANLRNDGAHFEEVSRLAQPGSETGLPNESADFVWGEDAWCYVADKHRLIAEAAPFGRPSGKVVFSDWLAGPDPIGDEEAERD